MAKIRKKKSDWISVEDQLPDPLLDVLVFIPEDNNDYPVWIGWIDRDGFWHEPCGFCAEPTHWQPLPEAPA